MKETIVLLVVALMTIGFSTAGSAGTDPKATESLRQDVLYTCDCKPDCKCNTVSTNPGKCKCGTPLKWGHVVKVEGNEALLCMCKEGCKCAINANDPSKCGCGTPVKRVSLKGTGIYFCNCGGTCTCNVVSDRPGNCTCGMSLKKVD